MSLSICTYECGRSHCLESSAMQFQLTQCFMESSLGYTVN